MLNRRVAKFLVGGGIAAAFNLFVIALLVEYFKFNTPSLRNIANIISIELSLLLSFFIYRAWVWPGGVWKIKEVLLKQLPLYHLSAGAAVLLRVLILFPLLDRFEVNYGVNTLLGVLLSASVNYLISDRLIFASKPESSQELSHSPDLFYPEGLAPGLANIEPDLQPKSADHSLGVFSLVMPAYNEEDTITETVSSIANFLSQQNLHYELLVINDNSKDGTEAVLQSLVSAYPNVRYINSYYPNGFGFAVRCGLESFQGDAVAIVMADGSDSAEDILKYYQKLREGYDCVFGSRFVRGGEVIDYPGHKLLINRLANIFVQVLFAIPYNDTTNAFKAYRREVIEGISPLISHHFNLTVEILLKAIVRQYSFEVVPITWRNRKAGISKLKIREMGSRYLFIVLSVLLERWLSRGDYVRKPTPKASIPSKQ